MKYTAALVLVTLSMVHGSILGWAGPTALKGPSAAATLVGPDGSAISSAVEGGAVLASPSIGVAGAWAAPRAWAAPSVALGGLGTVIQGPSGIVATNGNPWGAIGARSVGIVGPVGPLGLGLGHGVWRR